MVGIQNIVPIILIETREVFLEASRLNIKDGKTLYMWEGKGKREF